MNDTPEIGAASTCRTCNLPITYETVKEYGYLPRTGWSDGNRSDPLVCFKALDYRHVPPTGVCRRCGRTEGCTWAYPDICSNCTEEST